MERESDHVPECKPVGHPSYALDEIVVLRMLCVTLTEYMHAMAEERDAFTEPGIRGAAYLTEYISDRLEAYVGVLQS